MLKKRLGGDEDGDLVRKFEIVICDNNTRCKLDCSSKKFASLDELLSAYKKTPLHPAISHIGKCCESPRYRLSREACLASASVSPRASASVTKVLTQLKTKEEEQQKMIDDMQAKISKLEKKQGCTIL